MYFVESTTACLNSKTARLGSGQAVQRTLYEVSQKLLLVAVIVKQRLDVVVALPGYGRQDEFWGRQSPASSSAL
jgi:hypothetical protein